MPSSQRAIALTDTYRARTAQIRARGRAVAASRWGLVDTDDLDGSHARWRAAVIPAVTELQRANARLSAAYVAGFVTLETGAYVAPSGVSAGVDAVGFTEAGKPVDDALRGGLFAVKAAIGEGRRFDDALAAGRDVGLRMAGEAVMFAARAGVAAGMASDSRVVGWRRVTAGGCGACLASSTNAVFDVGASLEVHPECKCSSEPVVSGGSDAVLRPTGLAMFEALTPEKQDQLLGPDKARIVRDGLVPFDALVDRSPMNAIPDQITETPLEALLTH